MRFISLLIVLSIALVFYLSWIPNPRMSLVWFLPDWIANWSDIDENENIRTAVPFVFIGLLSGVWLSESRCAWRSWLLTFLSLIAIVLLAEAGQLVLPKRSFSWEDVVWGAIGSIIGLVAGFAIISIKNHFQMRFSSRK